MPEAGQLPNMLLQDELSQLTKKQKRRFYAESRERYAGYPHYWYNAGAIPVNINMQVPEYQYLSDLVEWMNKDINHINLNRDMHSQSEKQISCCCFSAKIYGFFSL